MEKSQALYEQLIPYDETLVFTDLSSFEAYRQARQGNVTALEEMSQRRKLQLAKTYQQFAEQKVTKAAELRVLLTSDERFSMTEAERLEILRRMQDYLLSSQQLKIKADALMQQTSDRPFRKSKLWMPSAKLRNDRCWRAPHCFRIKLFTKDETKYPKYANPASPLRFRLSPTGH